MSDPQQLAGRKVVVTGATGFIGRRLVTRLCEVQADVTALLRSGHGRKDIETLGAKVAVGAARGPDLAKAMASADILFNFAYDVRAGEAENLAAFQRILTAAAKAGVQRIVHASSAVVYDDWPNGTLDETSPITTADGGPYRQAKIKMEHQLMQSDFAVAILQPTIVYGPGGGLWTDMPMAQMKAGGVVLPDPVGHCPLVYVDDVVDAALRAAALDDLGRERFLISGADNPLWSELYQAYGDIVQSGEVRTEPLQVLQARLGPDSAPQGPSLAARISAQLRAIIGRKRFEQLMAQVRALRSQQGVSYPDRSGLVLYSANPDISTKHAQTRLGFRADHDLGKGMAKIVSAYGKARGQ